MPPPATPDPSLRQLLRQLWAHLARRRRVQLGVLLLVMLASITSSRGAEPGGGAAIPGGAC